MAHIDESHILLFLIQLLLLLGFSRALGILFSRWRQPTMTAEIMVGLALGPTVLGRFWPEGFGRLFPAEAVQWHMLDTVAWLGILFFLLKIGIEMDLASAWRQRSEATIIAITDVIVPMLVAFVPSVLLAGAYKGQGASTWLFAVFIATVSTISALPMTARVLQDLRLYRTDLGFLIMCALTVNDIIGWVIFTLVLGLMTQTSLAWHDTAALLAGTLIFTAVGLTFGRAVCHRILGWMQRHRLAEPGASLTFIALLGFVCGAITVKIGIHALFGFFIAGMMVGESPILSERTRNVIAQMVDAIFVPLFFSTIALKVDFFAAFDWFLVSALFGVGIGGRFLGAWLGTKATKQTPANRLLISIAHTPGGEMQIVVGTLALQYGLITEPVFVAIVCSAIGSSVILGPWMKAALKARKAVHIEEFFVRGGTIANLKASTRQDAIAELCRYAAKEEPSVELAELVETVSRRESQMGTALGEGVAMPHGRIAHLPKPMIVFGRSIAGIDWNAPDGQPARFIFLVLTPQDDPDTQLHILRNIALVMTNEHFKKQLADATDDKQLWDILHSALMRQLIPQK